MKRIVNITLSVLLLSFVLLILFTSCEKHEHAFGEWQIALEPTCVAEGIEERTCECGEKETKAIPMIAHKKGNWVEVLAATCTEEGVEERVCECGEKQSRPLAKIPHKPSKWYTDVAENVFGKGSKYICCENCKEILQTEEIPQLVHYGLAYEVNPDGETCTITGFGSAAWSKQIGVPTEIDGYKVVAIGDRAFAKTGNASEVNYMYIPEGVTYIGAEAFDGQYFTQIWLPDSLISVSDRAFYDVSTVYFIYDNALYLGNPQNPYVVLLRTNNENITSVTVHENTKIIYSNAFWKCKELKKAVIPDGVRQIGADCFERCESLEEVNIPASITTIHQGTFSSCYNLKKDIIIPAGVTTIEKGAFSHCSSLEKVQILGESLTIIGENAFDGCEKLTEINIPNSLKRIERDAFSFCKKLKEINIPDGIEFLDSSAFEYCDSLKCNEYENMLYLGPQRNPYLLLLKPNNEMISYCKIHEDTKDIAGGVFIGLEYLKTIIIPENLAALTEYVKFASCPVLDNVVIPKGTTYICSDKFVMCTFLKTISLPEGIKEIGSMAFYSCRNLETITFSDGLEIIGYNAFLSCLKLKSIYLPGSLQEIQEYAFDECTSLTDIYFDGTKEQWEKIQKGENWDRGTAKYTVHCTDGDIKKQ